MCSFNIFLIHISLSSEARITELHMAFLLILMDYILPKKCALASMQPQQRLKSNCGHKDDLIAIAHELLRILNPFHASWQPLVRPSKCPLNHCQISISKKVFRGHSKRPNVEVSFHRLPNIIFMKILHFWNPQMEFSY